MTLEAVTSFLKEIRWWIIGGVGVLLILGIWKPSCPRPVNDMPATPVNTTLPIPESDHSIPSPEGAYRDRQTYTHRDTVKPSDSVGTIFTTTITVYNPKEPGTPPLVQSSTPVTVDYTPIREPYIHIIPRWHFGVSSGYPFKVSPWLGVSVLTFWSVADVGASVDMMSAGAFLDFKVYHDLHLGAQYSLFKFSEGADVRVTLSLQLF
jgi:hypothetical protein